MNENPANDDEWWAENLSAEMWRRYPRAFAKWNAAEEQRLLADFLAGKGIDELAAAHGRRPGGIASRLAMVGMFQPLHTSVDETPSARDYDGVPVVLCDGCGVGLDDLDVHLFEPHLELCAACYCAALRGRTSRAR